MNGALKKLISEKFRNTPMGFSRIRRNLDIIEFSDSETVTYLRNIILATLLDEIETKGKNHYFKCLEHNSILTVNAHTFTIITAKKINKNSLAGT